jgi:hypothetical protein
MLDSNPSLKLGNLQMIFEIRQLYVGADEIGVKLSAIHTENKFTI